MRSVVSLALDPASGVAPQQELSRLVVAEDQDGEGDGRQPPVELERVHPEPLVHAGSVTEETGNGGLEDQPKIHEMVLHD